MKIKELIKNSHCVINDIIKHGRRAEYIIISKNNIEFSLSVGSGHNILRTVQNANVPDNMRLISGSFTPDNVRFGLSDNEIFSILSFN